MALKGRERVEILDLLHATSALWTIVHQFYTSGSDQALAAMQLFTRQLLDGQVRALLKTLSALADANGLNKTQRQAFTKAWDYLHNHRTRMRYHRYLAAGYPIASGVIEGACRHVVKDRMERSGIRGGTGSDLRKCMKPRTGGTGGGTGSDLRKCMKPRTLSSVDGLIEGLEGALH